MTPNTLQAAQNEFASESALKPAIPPIGLTLLALCAASLFFWLDPSADLSVSRLFYSPGSGFPVGASSWGRAARAGFITITDGSMAILALVLALSLVWPRLRRLPRRAIMFAVAVYLAVPGILVNAIIKPMWDRARPRHILEFGGTLHHTSLFDLSGQCHQGCSFVSGEASTLFTCATLICLLEVPHLQPKRSWLVALLVVVIAVAGSLLRIAFGAHFLSDVVFAAILSVGLTAIAHALMQRWIARENIAAPEHYTVAIPLSGKRHPMG